MTEYHFRIHYADFTAEIVLGGEWSLYDLAEFIIETVGFDFDRAFEFQKHWRGAAFEMRKPAAAFCPDSPAAGSGLPFLTNLLFSGKWCLCRAGMRPAGLASGKRQHGCAQSMMTGKPLVQYEQPVE